MTKCPWFPSHDVSPSPEGLDIGDVGTDNWCHLQYVVTGVNPIRIARDEVASVSAINAMSMRRKATAAEYKALLKLPKVAKAMRRLGIR